MLKERSAPMILKRSVIAEPYRSLALVDFSFVNGNQSFQYIKKLFFSAILRRDFGVEKNYKGGSVVLGLRDLKKTTSTYECRNTHKINIEQNA